MIEVNELKIKKSNIEALKKRYQWVGSGTREDPIEISTTENLPNFLKFKTKDNHIKISNVRLYSIKLKHCQHITIYNCRIRELSLIFCLNVTVKNNEIKHIHMKFSKRNAIENNKISDLAKIYNSYVTNSSPFLPFSLTVCFMFSSIYVLFLILTTLKLSRLFELTSSELLEIIVFDLVYGLLAIMFLIWPLIILKKKNRVRKLKRIKRCRNDYRKVMSVGLKFSDLIEDNWK